MTLLTMGRKALHPLLLATYSTDMAAPKDSHGANHLTKNGPITQAVGKVGNAAQFTASGLGYMSIPDNADLSMGDIDFTVGAWVYLDSKGVVRPILSKFHDVTTTVREYLLQYDSVSDRFQFYVSNSAGTTTGVTANALGVPALSTWYFVLAWHDATANTINIQVNGGSVDSAAFSVGSADTTATFMLGFLDGGGVTRYWNGRIDSPFVSKRVLTAQERTDFYNGGNGIAYSALTTAHKVGLVSWWSLDDVVLPASLPVDIGGPASVTDTNNAMEQIGGGFLVNGTVVANDGIMTTQHARITGRAFCWKTRNRTAVTSTSNQGLARTNLASASVLAGGVYSAVNTFQFRDGSTVIDTLAWSSGEHQFIGIALSTGAILLGRDGTSGAWTLIWISSTDSSTPIYGKWRMSGAQNFVTDDWEIIDLGVYDSRFASDYAHASARIATNSAGDSILQTPDAWVEQTLTAATGVDKDLYVRWVDNNNTWIVRQNQAGSTVKLIEKVAGVETQRGSAASTFTNGTDYRMIAVCNGSTIKVFVGAAAPAITYSSASSFATATTAKAPNAGTELKSVPLSFALGGRLA